MKAEDLQVLVDIANIGFDRLGDRSVDLEEISVVSARPSGFPERWS